MVKIDAVNVVIAQNVLPAQACGDWRCYNFKDWKFHNLQRDPLSDRLVGKVSARRVSDNLIIWCNVNLRADDLDEEPHHLFNMIDHELKRAVDFIVSWQSEHRDNELCECVSCELCYS